MCRMKKSLKESLEQFWSIAKIDVPFRLLVTPAIQAQKIQIMTGELPVAAWLQMFEDSVPNLRFTVREYGILITTQERAPEGTMTVQDFWKRKKAHDARRTHRRRFPPQPSCRNHNYLEHKFPQNSQWAFWGNIRPDGPFARNLAIHFDSVGDNRDLRSFFDRMQDQLLAVND